VIPNPALGVFFHWLGGLASASFYVPYRGVKRWSWETYWLVGGFFSWIIAPWALAFFLTRDLLPVLSETPGKTIFWAIFFGLLWGVGGLTFGLTMRYLGLSLGMAVVLGLCAAFGTLMPPIFGGVFFTQVLGTVSGRVILAGVFVCLLGIAAAGVAGIYKERAMSSEQKKAVIKEFDLKKGIGVAVLSGVMSACFAYGLAAGAPIKALTLRHGTPTLWQGLPVLVVVLIGGFTTNFIWCLILNLRNKTGFQYFSADPARYPQIP
jgi:L-rhamnose-H+ transport protein